MQLPWATAGLPEASPGAAPFLCAPHPRGCPESRQRSGAWHTHAPPRRAPAPACCAAAAARAAAVPGPAALRGGEGAGYAGDDMGVAVLGTLQLGHAPGAILHEGNKGNDCASACWPHSCTDMPRSPVRQGPAETLRLPALPAGPSRATHSASSSSLQPPASSASAPSRARRTATSSSS